MQYILISKFIAKLFNSLKLCIWITILSKLQKSFYFKKLFYFNNFFLLKI